MPLLLTFLIATSIIFEAKPVIAENQAQQNTWISRAPMPTRRSDLGVAVVEGKIYAIGGQAVVFQNFLQPPNNNVGTNEEYDPANNTWTEKAPMPIPNSDFATAVYEGKIYCIGGNTNEVYNPANDSWEIKTPILTNNSYVQACVIKDKIYVIVGGNSPSSEVSTEVYDPTTDSWSTKTPMPSGTYGSIFVLDNKIHAICKPQVQNSFMEYGFEQTYDPTTDSWTRGRTIPIGFGDGGVGATTGEYALRRIYFINNPNMAMHGNQVYDTETGNWTLGADMPTGIRVGFAIAVLNDKLYAIGGYYSSVTGWLTVNVHYSINYLPTVEEYTPFGYGTPDPSYVIETTPPKISVVSPLNQTYNESSIDLVFSTDKAVNWTTFSIDGKDNVTINGNTTLTSLSNGLHNLTVYANDTFGNVGASETINFTVANPESFPILTVVAVSGVIVAVIAVASVLLVFRRHRKTPILVF